MEKQRWLPDRPAVSAGIAEKLAAQRCECHFERVWRCRCPKASVLAAGKAHGVKVGYHGADMKQTNRN